VVSAEAATVDVSAPRDWRLAGLIGGLTVARLLAARWIPLTEDEAYYRLWAQHLHLGYYDHPPMIAWWVRAGVTLAGDNALGVRLVAVLAAALSSWLVAKTTEALGYERATAFRAALWYNATLTVGVGGLIATPDAPLTLFWTATLYALARIERGGSPRWWLAAGAGAGLACISKYSALFLAPGAVLWLAASEQGRRRLLSPWPWLAVVVAAAIFATNIVWNAQHGWLTFAKQFGRVAAHRLQPGHLADLLVSQFFLLNPLVAIYAGHGAIRAWRERTTDARLLLPLAIGAPFAAYLMLHSLHDRVQAHWPVPLFSGFAILAAVAVERASMTSTARILRNLGVGAGLALSAFALTYASFPGARPVGRLDLILPLRGWPGLASQIETMREREGAAWIGVANYGAHAQLAATRRLQAPLISVIERQRYPDETANPDQTRPGLMVDLDRRMALSDLLTCFGEARRVGELRRGAPGGPAKVYDAYLVARPKVDLVKQGCPNNLGKDPR
jgi:4-amino-4-deoxy-L-arabinose transferase-like glycosyltransferase